MALDKLQGSLAGEPNIGGRVFAFFNGEVAPGINVAAANLQRESGISQAQARLAVGELVNQARASGETFAVGVVIPESDLLALLGSVISSQDTDPLADVRVWLQNPRPTNYVRLMIIDRPTTTMHVFDSESRSIV